MSKTGTIHTRLEKRTLWLNQASKTSTSHSDYVAFTNRFSFWSWLLPFVFFFLWSVVVVYLSGFIRRLSSLLPCLLSFFLPTKVESLIVYYTSYILVFTSKLWRMMFSFRSDTSIFLTQRKKNREYNVCSSTSKYESFHVNHASIWETDSLANCSSSCLLLDNELISRYVPSLVSVPIVLSVSQRRWHWLEEINVIGIFPNTCTIPCFISKIKQSNSSGRYLHKAGFIVRFSFVIKPS